ncbi:Derlin-2 [Rhizoctonia solani]|uniref:Derlin n=1 Tax=Rhizoctonia solani TaxID=456999 RepID=A0A8H8T0N2_9AGAM|nr:Derlin-2 [Rhizoctonia solani]QRW23638.1 Derlin-2 [Rhizoctonia solani]
MENIPREFNKIPPVTKFIVTATAIVSVPTMLGIFPATSIVFDPYGVMYRHEVWRLGTSWFYAPSSEFFLFVAGMFLLYHSAFNIETNLFQGRSADFAWQVILSGIAILTLNVPLKTGWNSVRNLEQSARSKSVRRDGTDSARGREAVLAWTSTGPF